MRFYFQQAVRAFILILFTIYIVKLHYTGDILKLINPKYGTISMIGVVILLILFVTQLHRVFSKHDEHKHNHDHEDHHHDHGYSPLNGRKLVSYFIIVLPLITGFLLPPSTLDASIAAKKKAMLSITNNAMQEQNSGQPQEKEESADENMENEQPIHQNAPDPNLDSNTISMEKYDQIVNQLGEQDSILMSEQVYSTYYEMINKEMDSFVGKEISLKGFVYKEDDFKSNQLVLGRFLITHCVADSSIIGFLSSVEDATELTEDTWVEATGTIYIEEYNGTRMPAINISDYQVIDEPEQPYLYPITIKYK
ncbi:TIGR03943 family putative permease subunit [Virgibacillus salexigens]|uniref:TIGR03943 family putative permease subunit n=1 Tax=Virgibacillus massiliensis TaxID=1462526 RepID=UPI00136F955B|nr:TIGR03943 family protein [Virgibacillus massiliensis]MYL42651.1 TIGR03943 family protein [Virgibacillus massiliensis]